MGKKKQNKGEMAKNTNKPSNFQRVTLREENTGRKQVNVSSMLKMEHLQKLAIWASGEGSIPCLAALFGRSLASNAEAAGVPLDRSLFTCLKCETILQPGDNCTVRIEKYTKKKNGSKKGRVPVQNNVVYTCRFCSHHNVMVGTTKGRIKNLLASRPKQTSNETTIDDDDDDDDYKKKKGNEGLAFVNTKPGSTPCSVLSTKKGEIDESRSKPVSGSTTSKRRKKGWTNLKEIVESNANRSSFCNMVVPFKL